MSTPLELIHDALWLCLVGHGDFATMVQASNRVNYSGRGPEPDFDVAAPGAYPRVRIVPAPDKTQPRMEFSSTSCNPVFAWRIEALTGEQKLARLLQLWWHVYVALLDWETYLGASLTWQSQRIVYNVFPAATSEIAEFSQGSRQWHSLWLVNTEISLPTSVIRSTLQ